MPERRRLGGLQIGVVGRKSVTRGACVSCERRGLVGECVVELAHGGARRQPEPDAKRLTARAAGAQPPCCGPADAPLQLGLTRVERIAESRVPGKHVTRNRMQLEQPTQKRLCVVARQVAAFDERNSVCEIRE